uniref:FecR family protein n=1 Tax=uncultured Draconibacterium sp. TaxID=1573823 RepID=UPI003217B7A2
MTDYSKYLENEKFVRWVFNPDDETDLYWKNYLDKYPETRKKILQLKESLSFLVTKDDSLSSKERYEILLLLYKQVEEQNKNQKRIRFRKYFFRSAAVVLILVTAGAYMYFSSWQHSSYSDYVLSDNEVRDQKSVQLVLSNNESVSIDEDNSVINYESTGEVQVHAGDEAFSVEENKGEKNTLIVPYGKRSKLQLSDDTWIHVNSGSQLIYPSTFDKNKREVYIDGEAYFEVAENKNSPFIVKTPDDRFSVEVLGTRFNVSAYNSDTNFETVLTDGVVNIIHKRGILQKEEMRLSPGEMASWDNHSDKINIAKVNPDNYTLWTQGILLFENLALNRIVKKLERYYNITIKFEDPLKGSVCIGGKLDLNKQMEVVLENLAITASLKLNKLNETEFLIK